VSDRVRVSVVMTVPAEHAGFAAALRSALASDMRELEVVVVENGPAAHHPAEIRDPRVVRVGMRSGQRALRLRNVGIARARAPYVALLDPDDVLKPGRLSATVSALDRNPEAGFAFSDYECIDGSGRVTQPSGIADRTGFPTVAHEALDGSWRLIRQASLARGLLSRNFIGTSGAVMRRQLLSEIGPFDEGAGCCADLDVWFRLARRCGALYCSEVGYSHYDRPAAGNPGTSTARMGCIAVLRRERDHWSDREARGLLDRAIADNFGCMADDERRRGSRLRSAVAFASAYASSRDPRWLTRMLRSILT
jgi:GT2 family glycosyltransferase